MDPDSGDVDSLHGGLSLLEPLVDRILVDTVSQQQGWLRVYGKKGDRKGDRADPDLVWILSAGNRAKAEVMEPGSGTKPEPPCV